MNPMLRDQLREWKKKHMDDRQRDKLSFREIERLMGIHRPTYVRAKGGAFRQK